MAGLKKVMKTMKAKVNKKGVKVVNTKKPASKVNKKVKKPLYECGDGQVTKLKLPDGWTFKEAAEVSHVKLDVRNLKYIYFPLTAVEQFHGLAPKVYSEDSNGLCIKGNLKAYGADMHWSPDLEESVKLLIQTISFLRVAASRVSPVLEWHLE